MEKYRYNPAEMALMEKSLIPFAIYQFIDKRVVTLVLSEGFCRLFDLDREEAYSLMDHDMYRDTHPDDAGRIANAAFLFAMENAEYNVVYRSKVKEQYRIIHSRGEHIYTDTGERLAVVWYTDEGLYETDTKGQEDVLNQAFIRVLKEESLNHKLYYDILTGLPNKTGFFEMAQARRRELYAQGLQPAIVMLNLNGMRYYNRRYGYRKGDQLLQKTAQALASRFGNQNCSRFGIDIFAVLAGSENLEEKLHEVFLDCSRNGDIEGLTIRAGIALDPGEFTELSALCDRAKHACDLNKGTLLSKFTYFTEASQNDIDKYQYVIENLDRAISEKWIQVYYQPIIRAANGRVCDEEALARWIDPVKGFLTPADFIPTLEEAKLIYKLDLFMVEQILEKMKLQKDKGLHVVPISINLSRNDFDACDIVAEVSKRVDDAGITRDKLTIEITESVVGTDFDFIKSQVERFRSLGFKVWMDDFGSGYSSLDVLQSIHFDLIKFDMRFLQKFDQGDESKIILTELIKMAIGLGIDTLAEGVETKEQSNFLREVGCTKLQGYYFCKPIPLIKLFERYETGTAIGFENPDETDYYTAIGRINLYDTAVIARENQESFRNYFDILPMTVLESNGDRFRMIRCNQSFREFADLMDWNIPTGKYFDYESVVNRPGLVFMKLVRQCGEDGNRAIIDDVMPNDTTVHALINRIAVNPVNGTAAIAVAVLGIADEKNQKDAATYAHIAEALSSDYFNLFYVNLDSEDFIQYNTDSSSGKITVERHGKNFFDEARKDAGHILYSPDLDVFIEAFTKENVEKSIKEHGAFTLTYRQMYRGEPVYVNMKAVPTSGKDNYIVIGVNNIDAQMKQQEAMERIQQEHLTYSRINALTGDLICIYTVDPVTDHYIEYSSIKDYSDLGISKEGDDFFTRSLDNAKETVYNKDLDRFCSLFSKEKVLDAIKRNKIYGLQYRLLIKDEPVFVSLKAAMVQEKDGPQIIIGIHDIDDRLKRDHEYERNVAIAYAKVNIDPLTGVKNKHAYDSAAEQLDEQINDLHHAEFAVTVFSMKNVSDNSTNLTKEEENKWVQDAAEIICGIFKRSPVFRLKHEEFAVISQGLDYTHLEAFLSSLKHINEKNSVTNGMVILFGTAKYERDHNVKSVYKRAVKNLKENYNEFKTVRASSGLFTDKRSAGSD